jgi:hypothetical protein
MFVSLIYITEVSNLQKGGKSFGKDYLMCDCCLSVA